MDIFIGRAEEIAQINVLLTDPACRLLTLVGPGGSGKTRLAMEVAARQPNDAFPDGVHFVALAPLSAPDAIVTAITSALGLQLHGGDPRSQLIAYLSDKKMLLVLDNFEHLRDGADLLADLLEAAPGVMLLVTSREVLNLRAEWVHPVDGLNYPDEGAMDAPEGYDAVQLFVERARRVQSGFSLAKEQPGVQRVCRLVEGMPLALELAATWLRTLSCEAIADEIARGNGFLATTMRDMPARHRSMRAVFDHSWRLLAEEERAAFARLSVFRGGFTRAAAETVAGASLDMLRRLGDKSLIRFNPDSARYHVHELLRQYAAEQLEASGEGDAARGAHVRHFAAFMAARDIDIKGRRQREGLDETEADFQNVRAAWEGAVARRDLAALDQMLDGLYWYCHIRGRAPEGKALFRLAEAALAPRAGEAPSLTWGRLLPRYADSAEDLRTRSETALRIACHYEDEGEIAYATWRAGSYFAWLEQYAEAIPYFERSLAQYQALGDAFYVGRVLFNLGFSRGVGVGYEAHLRTVQEGIAVCRAKGDVALLGYFLLHLSALDMYHGNYAEAERCRRELLDMWLTGGNFGALSMGKVALADALFWQGKVAESKALSEEALALVRVYQDPEYEAFTLSWLSRIASTEERYAEAWEYGQAALAEFGRNPVLQFYAHLSVSLAACGLGDFGAAQNHIRTGLRIMSVDLQLAGTLTICLPTLALILAHEGRRVRAAEVLGLAFGHPVGPVGWMAQWPLLTRLRADLEAELGPARYAQAWARGEDLDLKATVADLLGETETAQQIANQALPTPLSARELEVLVLLAERLTRKEIATRLVVSVNTVKRHMDSIYTKLDVHNRAEAIQRARALDLL